MVFVPWCLVTSSPTLHYVSPLLIRLRNFFSFKGAAVVERLHVLPLKWKTRIRFPELAPTYHSSFHCLYPSYLSSSDGWGCKMTIPCIRSVLRARKITRVAMVEFHVSLYPISVSHFLPLCTINV